MQTVVLPSQIDTMLTSAVVTCGRADILQRDVYDCLDMWH